jgi:ABC-type branched-subunit amino acid transport system substrate-binding protein
MRKRIILMLVGLTVFGGLAVTGTGFAQPKGPINFVYITDLTGPAQAQVAPLAWAMEDYFNWRNQQGGIEGHLVNIELIDTKYALPAMRTAYTRQKDRKSTTISFDSLSGGIEALKEQFAKDKIPVFMCTGHGPALYPVSWVVAMFPPYDDTLCTMADWIVAHWKEKRRPRLALLLGDYASGRSPEMAKWYVEKKGIEVVDVEYVPLLPTDTSDLLIRIRNAKPDFIFDTLMPGQVKVVLRDRLKLGIKTPQVNFVFNSFLITQTVPPEAYDGYMGFQSARSWWEKDVPGVKFAYELYKKRGKIPPYTYVAAVGGALIWEEAVRNAIKKVGFEKLDGPAILDGYLGIKKFDAMGIFKNVEYTKDDLRGTKWLKICELHKDGSITNVTDWMEAPWNLKLKAESGK